MSELTIPTLSAAHAQALTMMLGYDATLAELAAVIESDPGITITLLGAANSAASAPIDRVAQPGDAIVRLGLDRTRELVLGCLVRHTLAGVDPQILDLEAAWEHVLASALLADAAVWADGPTRPDRAAAFTAGLLHDVGRYVMIAHDPDGYRAVREMIAAGLDPMPAERELFGVSHVEWGVEVAIQWALPTALTEAIRQHHGGGQPATLAARVELAHRAASALGFHHGVGGVSPVEPDALQALLVVVGGVDRLRARVDWYRSAMGAPSGTAAAAPSTRAG